MTKKEAIEAMKQGKRVTHICFTPNEYIIENSYKNFEFEDGCICSNDMFWMYRKEDIWLTGWSIWKG